MKKRYSLVYFVCILLFWYCSDKQDDWTPVLDVEQQEYTVSNDTGTILLNIISNGEWVLSNTLNWCRPDMEKGSGSAQVRVRLSANQDDEIRSGKLILKGQELEREIMISQSALMLDLDSLQLYSGQAGGTFRIKVYSNAVWKVENKVSWFKIDPVSGQDSGYFNITLDANPQEQIRNAAFSVRAGKIEKKFVVIQEGVVLEVDSVTLHYKRIGGKYQIPIHVNGEWTVTGGTVWCQVEKQENNGSFQVVVLPVSEGQNRMTTLTVRCGEVVRNIKVYQGIWHNEGEVRLYRDEDLNNPVKLVFMGDGFIEEDLTEGGNYDQAMEEAIEAFLATEPYITYRNYFCPYIVYAYSAERGMSTRGGNDQIKVKKETAFSVDVKEGTTLMNADMDKILSYAKKISGLVTTRTSILVAVNDSRYAGTCYHWGNGQTVSLIPMNRDLRPPGGFAHLVTHEGAGHGFGRLADEYTGNGQITDKAISELENHHNKGQFWNVTASQDPNTVYWRDFIGHEGYEGVGFFEGAYTYGNGVWRCERRNCMIDNIFYFSVACRLAIVKRLKEIAGEIFDLEDFIAKDRQKAPTPEQLAGDRSFVPAYYPTPTSPIFVKE